MAAVADQASVATGSGYRHFPGKAELVVVFETPAKRALKEPRRAYVLLAEPVDDSPCPRCRTR